MQQLSAFQSLAVSFVRRYLPHMDEHTLQAANAVIRANDRCENVQDLLHAISQRLTPNDLHTPSRAKEASWQATVRQSVQDIVYPAEIAWMEGDDLFAESEFAARALEEIKVRFTR
jgi:hypothetical protein